MSDLRESFPTLEIANTQEGAALEAKSEGDAASGLGAIGFSFKDSSGNVVLPQLDSAGRIRTVGAGAGTPMRDSDKVVGSAVMVDIAVIPLTANKTYHGLEWNVACFRDAEYEVVQNNNGAETIHAYPITGPGDLTDTGALESLEFTAGATGTQEIKVRGRNLNALSDLRASLVTTELP